MIRAEDCEVSKRYGDKTLDELRADVADHMADAAVGPLLAERDRLRDLLEKQCLKNAESGMLRAGVEAERDEARAEAERLRRVRICGGCARSVAGSNPVCDPETNPENNGDGWTCTGFVSRAEAAEARVAELEEACANYKASRDASDKRAHKAESRAAELEREVADLEAGIAAQDEVLTAKYNEQLARANALAAVVEAVERQLEREAFTIGTAAVLVAAIRKELRALLPARDGGEGEDA
jgi:hypothetical protein